MELPEQWHQLGILENKKKEITPLSYLSSTFPGLVHELPASKSFVKLIKNAHSWIPTRDLLSQNSESQGMREARMCIFNKLPHTHTRDFHTHSSCKPPSSKTQPDCHGLDNLRKPSMVGRKSLLQSVVKNVPEVEQVALANIFSENNQKMCVRWGYVYVYVCV